MDGEAIGTDRGCDGDAYYLFRAHDHGGDQDFPDGAFKCDTPIFVGVIADRPLDIGDNRIGVAHIPERENGGLDLLEALRVACQEKFVVPIIVVVEIHGYNIRRFAGGRPGRIATAQNHAVLRILMAYMSLKQTNDAIKAVRKAVLKGLENASNRVLAIYPQAESDPETALLAFNIVGSQAHEALDLFLRQFAAGLDASLRSAWMQGAAAECDEIVAELEKDV